MGATFLAIATSRPEVSTSTEEVRRGRHRLAFSNIFGTNLLDVGFLFTADIFYREGSVLDEVGDFSLFAAMLGIWGGIPMDRSGIHGLTLMPEVAQDEHHQAQGVFLSEAAASGLEHVDSPQR